MKLLTMQTSPGFQCPLGPKYEAPHYADFSRLPASSWTQIFSSAPHCQTSPVYVPFRLFSFEKNTALKSAMFICFSYLSHFYKTNTQIAKELKITPILDKLLEHKRNWIQHVNRLPRVMKHYSPTGRKNHGRPLKRGLDT